MYIGESRTLDLYAQGKTFYNRAEALKISKQEPNLNDYTIKKYWVSAVYIKITYSPRQSVQSGLIIWVVHRKTGVDVISKSRLPGQKPWWTIENHKNQSEKNEWFYNELAKYPQ